jgi:hypothetical protein
MTDLDKVVCLRVGCDDLMHAVSEFIDCPL